MKSEKKVNQICFVILSSSSSTSWSSAARIGSTLPFPYQLVLHHLAQCLQNQKKKRKLERKLPHSWKKCTSILKSIFKISSCWPTFYLFIINSPPTNDIYVSSTQTPKNNTLFIRWYKPAWLDFSSRTILQPHPNTTQSASQFGTLLHARPCSRLVQMDARESTTHDLGRSYPYVGNPFWPFHLCQSWSCSVQSAANKLGHTNYNLRTYPTMISSGFLLSLCSTVSFQGCVMIFSEN